MLYETHSLNHGANLELTLKAPSHGDGHGLVAVLGGGRGCVLRVNGLAAAVWIPFVPTFRLAVSCRTWLLVLA